MDLIIRLAKLEEAKKIAEINMETWKTSFCGYVSDEVLDTRNITEDFIKNRLFNIYKNNVFVAEVDGEVVGYSSFKKNTETEAEISTIYILPKYQKLGIGGILLKEVLKNLKELNFKKVVIWTMKNFEQSNNFYKKYGGVLTGNTKKYEYDIDVVEFVFSLEK